MYLWYVDKTYVDITKVRDILRYHFKIIFEHGIEKFIEGYNNNNLVEYEKGNVFNINDIMDGSDIHIF